MSIGKVLVTLRKQHGYSQDVVAKRLNVTRQAVARWERDISDPPAKKLTEVANLFGVSVSTLFSIPDTQAEAERILNKYQELILTLEQFDFSACCGDEGKMVQELPQAKSIRVNESWFKKKFPFYKSENIKIITAAGDSMSPTIDDGDLVFIDVSQDALNREGIFFVNYDDQYFIKRVQRLGGGKLVLICDNKQYRDITIERGSQILFKALGRVVLNLKPREFK